MTKSLTVLFLLILSGVFAQDGTRVYEFVNITTSPRQAALGGNATSSWDSDPNMSYWNPALMNSRSHGQVAMNYVNYLADLQFGTISAVYEFDEDQFLSFHGHYIDYGDFRGFDENDNFTGDFSARDASLTVGYARRLSDFFTVGANLKYINSRIESYSSSAIATDFGIVFHDIDFNTNVALAVRNIGAQLDTYDGKKEKMPVQVNLGISHILEHVPIELTFTFHDLQKFDISYPYAANGREVKFYRKLIDHVSVGAELFPQEAFNIRIGYNFKRANELELDEMRTFAGFTYGFGIRLNAFRFEFGHANYYKGSNTNHFGLTVNLDRLLLGRRYWISNPHY